ncbi:MAG: DUF4830 domain-containing protein [Ruminococcaceae bacterium]|nr:DUF4830 domain-containing protein [Oscillospiraceae bacterium]
MLIKAIKVTKAKVFALFAAVIVIAGAIILAVPPAFAEASGDGISYKKIKTNEDRVEFLKAFGWEVDIQPAEVVETVIPEEFPAVFERYNEIQKAQGLDLTKYKGKTVKRWTYRVTNYPDAQGEVHANVIVYKDRIIAGDICSTAASGFVHGFSAESQK